MGEQAADELLGMPEPYRLSRFVAGGETVITRGPYVVNRYETEDLGLRNLALVSLTDAGHSGLEVAECFGLTPQYVSVLRGRAKASGSAGLVRRQGRPSKLSPARTRKLEAWSRQGMTNAAIASRLGVHPGTVGRWLERRGPDPVALQGHLGLEEVAGVEGEAGEGQAPGPRLDALPGDDDEEPAGPIGPAPSGSAVSPASADTTDDVPAAGPGPSGPGPDAGGAGLARLGEAEVPSRYAGAMLLHPFLERVGALDILSALPSGAARRYDATAVVLAATFGLALGASSMEGTKHLQRAGAGALAGLTRFPELRTLRPRLCALAEASDPLALQRAFAKGMLRADEAPTRLFFCDEHFVAYTGAAPVGKGYNIRRHRAEPGRDDVFVTDGSWRAICFDSNEPRGLSVALPGVLGQLRELCGDMRVMVGFDRGGSYPKVFASIREANMDWVTYRRAPLVAPTARPHWSWTMLEGHRVTIKVADEVVGLKDYGEARQLSVYEGDRVVFQVLTSDLTTPAATLVRALRRRWSIENTFKYLEDNHGIHWLCDYRMDVAPDHRQVPNPARQEARAAVTVAEAALAGAERALAQNFTDPAVTPREANAASPRLRREVDVAWDDLADAEEALGGIPAKLRAAEVDPGAKRARPRLAVRSLQMVCRLLAYNAELDLARRLDAYLGDLDEYRGITRNLLHLGGVISFAPKAITVTLDRPHPPRLARALGLLLDEINLTPPRMTGDGRPIGYRMTES